MSQSLNSLFPSGSPDVQQLYVFNSSTTSASNGGFCCLWTVPTGITWGRFEVWGGGGRGGGSCCCQQPAQGGGAGAYARRSICLRTGDTYRICAGGSTDCSNSCCGTQGFPSFVNLISGVNSISLCAAGGPPTCSQCFIGFSGCICIGNTVVCNFDSFSGHDFGLPSITGAAMMATCGFQGHQFVPSGPYSGGGARSSRDYCIALSGENSIGCSAIWPGGGGGGAVVGSGNFCWGGFGAGGLVVVTFG